MEEAAKAKPVEQRALAEEMKEEAEPLSSAEKKLIGYSLLLGIFLLLVMILLTGAYKF